MMKNCALPECNKPFSNWRMSCFCRSHQGRYSAKKRHGTLGLPDKISDYIRKTPILTAEEKRIKRKIYRINYKKLRSTSKWADKDKIAEIYKESARLEKETGILHEVDHIIPTLHKLVCGLHNEFNLQILTKEENRKKRNKFEPYEY
jgi:hypothetical protein